MQSGKVDGLLSSSQKAGTPFTARWKWAIWRLVYALVGDQKQAITLVERLLSNPGAVSFLGYPPSITLAELRLGSQWDSLRSNPRFQKILVGPEPATILTDIH